MPEYHVPAEPVEYQEEIKKSRFITYLRHAPTVDKAKTEILAIKAIHPQARHHCWGYVAGVPMDSQCLGFSDDGEPCGTAGKPILAQLQGSGVGEIVAVVVRYYGGVLLGTGGLVRAYGQGVQQALKQLTTHLKVPLQKIQLRYSYEQQVNMDYIYHHTLAEIYHIDYQEVITANISVPESQLSVFMALVQAYSKGQVVPKL